MRLFNAMFLLLFSYIVAALIFWGVSLERQSERIYQQDLKLLYQRTDSVGERVVFEQAQAALQDKRKRRRSQYIGEGSAFLFVIVLGAAVVYSSFRRSMRLSRQQNNFMLAVTHELKSPIAAVKLNLQTLEKYQLSEEKKAILIDRTIKESGRLNDLCNNMLLASQIEGGQLEAARERLRLSELFAPILAEYAYRYPHRIRDHMTARAGEAFVNVDRLMFQMMLSNLLENAIKYAPAGSPIDVETDADRGMAHIKVKDQGAGIPDGEKKKVFRKFYRVGNENTRKAKGTGLGLYLVQKIIKSHRGTVTVVDNEPSGACFYLRLPLAS